MRGRDFSSSITQPAHSWEPKPIHPRMTLETFKPEFPSLDIRCVSKWPEVLNDLGSVARHGVLTGRIPSLEELSWLILETVLPYRSSILFDGRYFVTGSGGYASVTLVMLLLFEFEQSHWSLKSINNRMLEILYTVASAKASICLNMYQRTGHKSWNRHFLNNSTHY